MWALCDWWNATNDRQTLNSMENWYSAIKTQKQQNYYQMRNYLFVTLSFHIFFLYHITDIIDAIKQCKSYNLVIRHQIRLDRIIRVKMTFHCHWLTPKINPHHEILQLRMVNFNSFTMLNKKKILCYIHCLIRI